MFTNQGQLCIYIIFCSLISYRKNKENLDFAIQEQIFSYPVLINLPHFLMVINILGFIIHFIDLKMQ